MLSNDQILASSVQLCQLDASRKAVGWGSGCIVRLNGRTMLLTVEHVTGNQGNWAIELEYDKVKGAKCHQIGAMNFIMRMTLQSGATSTPVDFSYAAVPPGIQPFRHFVDRAGDTIAKHEVPIYDEPFDSPLSPAESYSFAGAVMADYEPNLLNPARPILKTTLFAYTGLKFLRSGGDFHVFKLPFAHPGHVYFQGCSGAPILNEAGQPVALVANGNLGGEIFGIALNSFLPMVKATM